MGKMTRCVREQRMYEQTLWEAIRILVCASPIGQTRFSPKTAAVQRPRGRQAGQNLEGGGAGRDDDEQPPAQAKNRQVRRPLNVRSQKLEKAEEQMKNAVIACVLESH